MNRGSVASHGLVGIVYGEGSVVCSGVKINGQSITPARGCGLVYLSLMFPTLTDYQHSRPWNLKQMTVLLQWWACCTVHTFFSAGWGSVLVGGNVSGGYAAFVGSLWVFHFLLTLFSKSAEIVSYLFMFYSYRIMINFEGYKHQEIISYLFMFFF